MLYVSDKPDHANNYHKYLISCVRKKHGRHSAFYSEIIYYYKVEQRPNFVYRLNKTFNERDIKPWLQHLSQNTNTKHKLNFYCNRPHVQEDTAQQGSQRLKVGHSENGNHPNVTSNMYDKHLDKKQFSQSLKSSSDYRHAIVFEKKNLHSTVVINILTINLYLKKKYFLLGKDVSCYKFNNKKHEIELSDA